MANLKSKISYILQDTALLRARLFWIFCVALVSLLFLYIYFTFSVVGLSYGIDAQLLTLKKETVQYQELEEKYASALENVRVKGLYALNLSAPKDQIFIERASAVARAGL